LTWTVTGITSDGYAVLFKSRSTIDSPHFDRDLLFSGATYFHPIWPLSIGESWKFTHEDTPQNGVAGRNTYATTETVVGWEFVSVPAGTFQAIKIHGRECNVTQQKGCGDFDVWYASDVKWTVKIAFTAGYWSSTAPRELVSYKVAK